MRYVENGYILSEKVEGYESRIWKIKNIYNGSLVETFDTENAFKPVEKRMFYPNSNLKIKDYFEINKNSFEIVKISKTNKSSDLIDGYLNIWGGYCRVLHKNDEGIWFVSLSEKIKDEYQIFQSKSVAFLPYEYKKYVNLNISYNEIIDTFTKQY